jgi:hypothetical protein
MSEIAGYASAAIEGAGTVSVGVASAEEIPANPSRSALEVVNNSDADVSLGLGEAAVVNRGLVLKAGGGSWNGMVGEWLWTGAVHMIHGGAGNKDVGYVEL